MSETHYIRKITPKTVMGKIVAPEKGSKPVFQYAVYGTADAVKQGESNYGTWFAFTGNFEANRHDGEIFRASVLFLPEPLQSILIDKLQDGMSVDVAVAVLVKPSDSPTGYEYVCQPLVETQSSDALKLLREQVMKMLPKVLSHDTEDSKVKKK